MLQLFETLPPDILSHIKLFIFDFDCTITNYHLKDVNVKAEHVTQYIDVDLFKAWIEYLQSQNIKVAVASFGNKNKILTLLQTIFDTNVFDEHNVITPRDMPVINGVQWKEDFVPPRRSGLNKNHMLQMLRAPFKISAKETYFLDDTFENITNAQAEGYYTVCVSKEGGFKSTLIALMYKLLSEDALTIFLEHLQNLA